MLMRRQLTTRDVPKRKRLASPNVLVGATRGLGNFRPTVLDHHALSNVEELFWRERRAGAPQ